MKALSYSAKYAVKSFFGSFWINVLSIFTIASGLVIISLAALFFLNVEIFTSRLPERFSMVVYLRGELSTQEAQSVAGALQERPEVLTVKLVSKEEALKELKQALRDASSVLDGLHDNPLSASVEVKLKKDFVTAAGVKNLSEEVRKIPGVDDVYYGEKIAETAHLLKTSVRNSALILFASLLAGIVFVSYSTVKILFYRKRDEIEILKLLGATRGFIRAPFVIEGGLIGFIGSLLGAAGTLVFYVAITYRLSLVIPLLKTFAFPLWLLFVLPLLGVTLGVVGSLIAVGRLKV